MIVFIFEPIEFKLSKQIDVIFGKNIVQIGIQFYGYILLEEYDKCKAKIENFKDYIDINKIKELVFIS